jgi:DNA repair ATPase RecN
MASQTEFKLVEEAYQQAVGQRNIIADQIGEAEEKVERNDRKLRAAERYKEVVSEVAARTMQNLEFHISNIVTTALRSIPFPEPLEFEAEFLPARNQVECFLWFVKGEHRVHPMHASGGGPKDVASFALRLTYWTLKKNRPTFILDEPFKYVSADLQVACAEMVKMLAEKIGVQIIMVSHLPNINITADKEYKVEMKGGKSIVREVEDELDN